jgi:NAD(P)-dependent dehydrogenase (short-subunit alcohol dehydrogenase family)
MTRNARPTALITGAAKRIGAMIAEHLAASGYDIILHYHRSGDAAQTVAMDLTTRFGANVTLVQADLSHPASLENFWHDLPPCELLIHNASQFTRDTLDTMTAETLRQHLAINFESPLLLSQGFMKQLPKTSSGNIIVLGDGIFSWSSAPQFFSYAASKHAWGSVIDLLAAACATNVRANLIALGPTVTGLNDDDAIFARLAERAPLKRHGAPDEVCQAIDFLLAAPGVTGQTISLANGFGLAFARPV